MNGHRLLGGFRLARSNHPAHDRSRHIHRVLGKVYIAPLQTKQLALTQTGRSRKKQQHTLTQAQTTEQQLDFNGRQHAWCATSFCTLANKTDRVTVEEFVTASMVEKHRQEPSDFGTTALRKWKTPQP